MAPIALSAGDGVDALHPAGEFHLSPAVSAVFGAEDLAAPCAGEDTVRARRTLANMHHRAVDGDITIEAAPALPEIRTLIE